MNLAKEENQNTDKLHLFDGFDDNSSSHQHCKLYMRSGWCGLKSCLLLLSYPYLTWNAMARYSQPSVTIHVYPTKVPGARQ